MLAVEIQSVGKKYILHHDSHDQYRTLRDLVGKKTSSFFRRILSPSATRAESQRQREEFWALRDVSFEIEKGERLGLIGRNGAGKSTLLKILSQIVLPTAGKVILRGRMASLLEVGTGFHPDLTGRENIYLNGAILGMSRADIARRFDEIVAFSEVEQFLDTPVKRYSSGMYVRLAFAVAAHLEPEILIVDEVLAVGDAQFQKKCLGKMEAVGREGRTVIFVSHSMGAVAQLCDRAVLLDKGQVTSMGQPSEVIRLYLSGRKHAASLDPRNFEGTLRPVLQFTSMTINGSETMFPTLSPSENIAIRISGECQRELPAFRITFAIFRDGVRLFSLHDVPQPTDLPRGVFQVEYQIPGFLLRPGDYSIGLGGYRDGNSEWLWGADVAGFHIGEEWGPQNDRANTGLINLPATGRRLSTTPVSH